MSAVTMKKAQSTFGRAGKIKRRDQRGKVAGFYSDIADGNFVFAGVVKDISSRGIKISDLPLDFPLEKSGYRTVISGSGKHYRVLLRPCWANRDSGTRSIEAGFMIVDAPWDWEEFVLEQLAHHSSTN